MTVALRENRQSLNICSMSSWTEVFQISKGDRQSGIDCRKNRKNGELTGIRDKIASFQFEHLAATRSACNDHGGQETARVDTWTIA
jgi:hypothetical protein